jgi:hypothetical protein
MPGSSLDTKTIYWILAGVFSAIFAIVGNQLSVNIVRLFSKRGPKPKKRPVFLWTIFYGSLITSIMFGALGVAEPPSKREYVGYVIDSTNGPVQNAKVTLQINNMTQINMTDPQGLYKFELPADTPANAQIVVSAEGFQSFRGDILLDANTGMIAEIKLIPETTHPLVTATATEMMIKTSLPPPTDTGAWATISCAVEQASLRRTPGFIDKDDSIDVIAKIDCGQKVKLLGDKQNSDDLTWWQVSWNSYTGWMADHTASGRVILILINEVR